MLSVKYCIVGVLCISNECKGKLELGIWGRRRVERLKVIRVVSSNGYGGSFSYGDGVNSVVVGLGLIECDR